MVNEQAATPMPENKRIDIANLEREKVIKGIKDLELKEQKNKTEDSRYEMQNNTGQIRFDFDGLLNQLQPIATSRQEHDDNKVISDNKAFEDMPISDTKELQPLFFESFGSDEMSTSLENLESADDSVEYEDTHESAEYEDMQVTQQVTQKEKRTGSVYDTDPLFGPMLKRGKNVSPFVFFAHHTDEELAIVIDNELYINRAATIRLMVKAEYANGDRKLEKAIKLWEAVCFYSIDSGYMNMAFRTLFHTVYQSNINEAKAIIKVMTKKEKKLLQVINDFSN